MIKKVTIDTMDIAYAYYLEAVRKDHFYVPITQTHFSFLMTQHDIFLYTYGIPSGLVITATVGDVSYISLLLGNSDAVNKLLVHVENIAKNNQVNSVQVHFASPINLKFYTKGSFIHPAAQGLIKDSMHHKCLKDIGYIDYAFVNTYYSDLTQFSMPKSLSLIMNTLSKSGIKFEIYNENHKGLTLFTNDLKNQGFQNVILNNEQSSKPKPLLISTNQNNVTGFAGPLDVSVDDHRGIFGGIGILEKERGQKIGKILFFQLCLRLKDMGATYMTLFTGEENPARYIYESAGFVITTRFVLLKKNIKD